MKLYIDTSDSKNVAIILDGKKFQKKLGRSQELLSLIEASLKHSRKHFDDIKEIKVKIGPGSFTGLRVGVSVANTLGWVLKIPVNGQNIGTGGLGGLEGIIEPLY